MSNRTIITFAAFFGLTAVILGAFGAHVLREQLTPQSLDSYRTGIFYQFIHALALLAISALSNLNGTKMKTFIGFCFIIGIFFFSGSIYFLSTKAATGLENLNWLGPITPIGGVFFIGGWLGLLLFYLTGVQRKKSDGSENIPG